MESKILIRKGSFIFCTIFLLLVMMINSCSNSSEPSEIDYGWVAVQANFYEQSSSHIYLVNYNNPSKYKQITFGDNNYESPKFSPDRKQIIIGDHSMGTPENAALMRYSFDEDTIVYLKERVPRGYDQIVGNDAIWHPAGETFYYYVWGSFKLPDIHSYNIFTEEHLLFTRDDNIAETVIDIIDANTMITWFSKVRGMGAEDNGYYLMDIDGNYLSKINNRHLVYLVVDDKLYQGAMNLRYNPTSELIVFTQKDSLLSGFNIAVTNLEGTYYKRYITDYVDDYPCWGPDDNTVLFVREELEDKGRKYTTIMKLNLQNGNVTEFVSPSSLDGATGLRHPNY